MSVPSILKVSHFSTGGWSTSSSAAPRKESLPLLLPLLVTSDPTVPWGTASLMWSSLQWSDVVDREVHHWVSDIHNPVSATPEWGVGGATVYAAEMVMMDLLWGQPQPALRSASQQPVRTEEVTRATSKWRCSFQMLKDKENAPDPIVNLSSESQLVCFVLFSFSNKEKRNYIIFLIRTIAIFKEKKETNHSTSDNQN